MFLAFPEVSLPRRLLQLARRGGRNTPCSRKLSEFGVAPHPRGEGDTITFHFWPFVHFLRKAFYQKCGGCVKKANAQNFRRNHRSKHRLLVRLPHAGRGRWNALSLGTYFAVASERGSIGC